MQTATQDRESMTESSRIVQALINSGARSRRPRGRRGPENEPKLFVFVKDYTLDIPILYFAINAVPSSRSEPGSVLHWSMNAVYNDTNNFENVLDRSTGFQVTSPGHVAEVQITTFRTIASGGAVKMTHLRLEINHTHPPTTRSLLTYILREGFHQYVLYKDVSGCLWWIQRLVSRLETHAQSLAPGSSDRLKRHIATMKAIAEEQTPPPWTISGVQGRFLVDHLNTD